MERSIHRLVISLGALACAGLFACATPSGGPEVSEASAVAEDEDPLEEDDDSMAVRGEEDLGPDGDVVRTEMVCKYRKKVGSMRTERVCVPRSVRDETREHTVRGLRNMNTSSHGTPSD